ncbi:hypothetical protein [Henriciella pelagia]|uniref:Uncharacterized protein n=1 Tax=Henriciella pelagia TaxID=1977912 RepID=A0ABQ1JY65_9PROT|nr:hypothetical protein [Henriciella pelagia]GGB81034.1 hypothetical protein GCM10011503_32270 [Henriciella pelagia]
MNPVFEQMRNTSKAFRGDQGTLQSVVFALDALRMNSDLPIEKLDDFYFMLEEINAVCLDQKRQLSTSETEEIFSILKEVEALMKASDDGLAC